MNLHLLRLFTAVVEQQGFSKAADVVHVTQSAISKAIKELESQLGLPLLERAADTGKSLRGVVLTDHGHALYEHARFLFALERAASDDMRDRREARAGHLRVGASTTIGGYWLPPILASFRSRFPGIALDLRIGNTGDIARALLDYELDLAVVEGEVSDPRLLSRHWQDEALVLVVPGGNPVIADNLTALQAQTWLLRENGSGTRQVAQHWLQRHALQPADTIELGSNEAIARSVAAGLGVALLPRVVVADLLALGQVVAPSLPGEQSPSRPLYLLELAQRQRTPAQLSFLACLMPS